MTHMTTNGLGVRIIANIKPVFLKERKKTMSILKLFKTPKMLDDYCISFLMKNIWHGLRGKLGATELRYSQLTATQFKKSFFWM